jgi:predicted Rossmann-fold nucleotide-binding protein
MPPLPKPSGHAKSSKKPYKTIGVAGARNRDALKDYEVFEKALLKILQPGDRLVSGGCLRGADSFAEDIAQKRGLTITIHFPDWDGPVGRGAGCQRNQKIAEDCDVLIAMPGGTGGTEDCMEKVLKLGKKVIKL